MRRSDCATASTKSEPIAITFPEPVTLAQSVAVAHSIAEPEHVTVTNADESVAEPFSNVTFTIAISEPLSWWLSGVREERTRSGRSVGRVLARSREHWCARRDRPDGVHGPV